MKTTPLEIPGVLLVDLDRHADSRGFFTERFQERKFRDLGLPTRFVQDNYSRSLPGVLRGLHFQSEPSPQTKLVTALRGRIYDVAVDLRPDSPAYKRWVGVELSGNEPRWLLIPAGCAHGFCVLGDEPADVLYKVDRFYDPQADAGIHWADPDIGVRWPIDSPLLSDKDLKLPRLRDLAR